MNLYENPQAAPAARADDLLPRLSEKEKLAQLTGILAVEGREDAMAPFLQNGIGQVSTLNFRECTTLEKAAEWQIDLQKRIMAASPHHIPAVFHMEGLCGAYLQGATSFPAGISRGASFDPELEEKLGEIVGRQERAAGITQTLAPVLDISRDSRMGRQGETYGEDPTLAAALGAAFTKGLQQESAGRRTDGAAKHFLGFHASQGGIHGAHAEIAPRTLQEIYAKPFQAAITEGGLKGIMPCYCCLNGEPLSASEEILTHLLREEMGFDGVTVSDYSAVSNVYNSQGMCRDLAGAGLRCLKAGMDVELPMPDAYNAAMLERLEKLPDGMEILDRAVRRVLEAKFRMGLFEHPFALTGEKLNAAFFRNTDTALTLQSARESLVLLRNDGTLPLNAKTKKIAVIGCHADNARAFFGGYTHLSMTEAVHAVANSMAGVGASGTTKGKTVPLVPDTQIQSDETDEFDALLRLQKPGCPSLLAALRTAMPNTEFVYAYGYAIAGDDTSHFAEALDAAKDADLIILTLGGKHGSCSVASMGEGVDGSDINLPYCQDEFIRQAAKLGKPMVGVHFNGRPISSDEVDAHLNAVLEAWNPSEAGGQAIAEVLTGAIDPGGRMPVTAARCAGQLPVYYNHPYGSMWHQGESIGFRNYVDLPHEPRYYFGEGLSYTTFTYGALTLDRTETTHEALVAASVKITNSGTRPGTEVVQLYLKHRGASMARPVLELIGFARVALQAGESKTVRFMVDPTLTAFLNAAMKWTVEEGPVTLAAGHASNDLRSEAVLQIADTAVIEGRTRAFYAKADIL